MSINMNRYDSRDQPVVTLVEDRGLRDSADASKQPDQRLIGGENKAEIQLLNALTRETRLARALEERLAKFEYQHDPVKLRNDPQDGGSHSTLVISDPAHMDGTPPAFHQSSRAPEFTYNSSVPLMPGAITHITPSGQQDYWLIKRDDSASGVTRAIPLGKSQLGVLVHSLDDGHNYVVTESGGWMSSDSSALTN